MRLLGAAGSESKKNLNHWTKSSTIKISKDLIWGVECLPSRSKPDIQVKTLTRTNIYRRMGVFRAPTLGGTKIGPRNRYLEKYRAKLFWNKSERNDFGLSYRVRLRNFEKSLVRKFAFDVIAFLEHNLRPGGGGTPLYKVYRYVPPQRVWFLSRFGLKTGIDFEHFGLKLGMVIVGTFTKAHKLIFLPSNQSEWLVREKRR